MTGARPAFDLRFRVEGTPVAKGNMSGFPIARGRCDECKPGKPCRRRNCFGGVVVGVSVTDQGGGELAAWQELVHVRALSARNAAHQRMLEQPTALAVAMVFVLARPAAHWTTRGELSAAGRDREFPTVKPDWDKVSRAVADGLTGALVHDDAQVTIATVAQVYAGYRGWTGVLIRAREQREVDAWVTEELAHHGISAVAAAAPARQERMF